MPPQAEDTKATPRALNVLVVEDEPALARLACRMLASLGHVPHAETNARVALEKLEQVRFDVLFTDVTMPDMDGVTLARLALKKQPGLRVLITSGYASGLLDKRDLPGPLLTKPYRKAELGASIDSLMA